MMRWNTGLDSHVVRSMREMAWPANYGTVQQLVDIAMAHFGRPCIGEPCDLDAPCKRHQKTAELAARLDRLRRRQTT